MMNYYVDVSHLMCGILLMLSIYTLSLFLNIRIKKGKYGVTSGRFKLCFIAAIIGLGFNMLDYYLTCAPVKLYQGSGIKH